MNHYGYPEDPTRIPVKVLRFAEPTSVVSVPDYEPALEEARSVARWLSEELSDLTERYYSRKHALRVLMGLERRR